MAVNSVDQVFISYSRKDEAVMRRIANYLGKQGIHVWLDYDRLIPGAPVWEEEIEKAIKAAAAVVVVMSPDSKSSEWVRREISLADQNRKRIFPVLVKGDEDSSVTLRLITRQYLDLRENEERGLAALCRALSQYLDETEGRPQEKSRTNAELLTTEKAVGGAPQQVETGKPQTPRVEGQKLLWVALGWSIGGLLGGFMYSDYGEIVGGAIGGVIGGLATAMLLRTEKVLSEQKALLWTTLAWTIAGVLGWVIGWWWLTDAIGAAIGIAVFAIVGLAGTLGLNRIHLNWNRIVSVILAWAICGGLGWTISRELIYSLGADPATGWAVGMGIGWAIGGFVMGWQLMKRDP